MEINLFKMDKIIKSFYEVYNGLDSEVRIQKICFDNYGKISVKICVNQWLNSYLK